MSPEEFERAQRLLADQAAVADIECEGTATTDEHGRTWYDTRPMLDPREVPDVVADMARVAIAYALHRGLASPHPAHSYLLRITARATL
jgi:hypothetical protein